MKKLFILTAISCTLLLSACETASQDVYDFREAGRSVIVDFGTIIDVRPIKIKGQNTGVGSVAGAAAGAGIGTQVGSGDGRGAAIIAGAVAGIVGGAIAEQAIQDQEGRDFTIVLENGETITVSQYFKKGEPILKKGERVMVQSSGSYQRVLPAEHLPEKVKRPKGIKVVD
jgi:outer membrane lipoprotein SlyB